MHRSRDAAEDALCPFIIKEYFMATLHSSFCCHNMDTGAPYSQPNPVCPMVRLLTTGNIFDHPITLAMTNGSCPPCGVSILHHKYFDLKTSNNGNIIHGVFVRIESGTRSPSVDTTYMVSNKEATSIITNISHCPLAWWYWH
jgi:hypothetical protein